MTDLVGFERAAYARSADQVGLLIKAVSSDLSPLPCGRPAPCWLPCPAGDGARCIGNPLAPRTRVEARAL
jgi:hypothetical protein